ncbi:hypothetical protein FGO68_gene11048 [Halteria grandinella]|uniref:MORN repeat protein n=1 Tax=Halteria grandinella TaxID=5974 RepID=A0A8J8T129_HALGN|nr:hypothetical protein FGO68_gene11048 [Halteria grandinella]
MEKAIPAASLQQVQTIPSLEQELSKLSIQPPVKFTLSGLEKFIEYIRLKGHDKLVDAALLHCLSVTRLNGSTDSNKEVRIMPFEGSEKLQSGGIYYGQCVNGMRDGYGLLYCTDNDADLLLYECHWKEGKPTEGELIVIFKNKWSKYEGKFDDRLLRAGVGSYQHEDGASYVGEFKDGQMSGDGKMNYLDGASYIGGFHDGKKNGHGKFIYPDGEFYDGQWEDGQRCGYGKMVTSDGETYEGQWKHGRTNGQGKFTQADGKTLEGEWLDDKLNGYGKYTSPDGEAYEGEWQFGIIQGKGKHTFPDGRIYQGQYKDGNFHGKGKCTLSNQDSYEGEYVDGSMHGLGKLTYSDGEFYVGQWEEGKRIGLHKFYSKEHTLLYLKTFDTDGKLAKIVESL